MSSFSEGDVVRSENGQFAPSTTGATPAGVLDDDQPTPLAPGETRSMGENGQATPFGATYGMQGEITEAQSMAMVRDGDGSNLRVEIEHSTDAFGPVEERNYPGYLSDRQPLVESYARQQWGAELDNASDWDDQAMTFRIPVESEDTSDVRDAVLESLYGHDDGTVHQFTAEVSSNDATCLSGLQEYLDAADERGARAMEFIKDRSPRGISPRSTVSVDQMQADLREHLAARPLADAHDTRTTRQFMMGTYDRSFDPDRRLILRHKAVSS